MAGAKETPRQKMIGMMYLVLTAMLALNVSKDILKAFAIINHGMETTNSSFSEKIEEQYGSFERAYLDNKTKAQKHWDNAVEVKKAADDLEKYIRELKAKVYSQSTYNNATQFDEFLKKDNDGRDVAISIEEFQVNGKIDDYDTPTYLLIGDDANLPRDGENSAIELQKKLENYRDKLKAVYGEYSGTKNAIERLDQTFNFEDVTKKSEEVEKWVVHQFYHQTVAATITLMTKLIGDVKTSEVEMLDYLMARVGAKDIKVNKLEAVVKMRSNYIAKGDSFVAEVFIAASDTTKNPKIFYGKNLSYNPETFEITGNKTEVKPRGGKGKIGFRTGSAGEQSWEGYILQPRPGGTYEPYKFSFDYKVAEPEAVLDPTGMNVFYIGITNPLQVSVPGMDSDDLKISSNSGDVKVKPVRGKSGSFEVSIGSKAKLRECTIIVKNKKGKKLGEKPFRIKRIPNPEPMFAGKSPSDNFINLPTLKAGTKIVATLKDFVFDGVKYKVIRFKLRYTKQGFSEDIQVRGDQITPDVRQYLNNMRKGQIVNFVDIIAKGPDGSERKLPALSFKVI